ncbi:MAG: calcium/sodium antiporter [Candidatus Omnitrophota bacterium]
MTIYTDIIILVIGIIVIIKSADLFTTAAESIALFFNIPRTIIGLTIVSFATTMPEFAVSAFSSYMKVPGIALGNATGSCLANIGLILAVAALINAVHFDALTVRKELPFLIMISGFCFLLMYDGVLSFLDGVILCGVFSGFLVYVVHRGIGARKENKPGIKQVINIKLSGVKFLLGAAGVVLSARLAIIPSGMAIAKFLKVPEIVIGVTMIAVGTSLPELVTAVISSIKKMGDLAAGNIIGANILNLLWVLGASSIINPVTIDLQTKIVTMPLVIMFSVVLLLFTYKDLVLSKIEGLMYLVLYSGYILYIVKFAYK